MLLRRRHGWHEHGGVKRALSAPVIALAMIACTPIRPLDEPGDGGHGADAGWRDAASADAGRDAGRSDAGRDAGCSAADLCDGEDDDCDPTTADGSGDPMVGASCDGADDDQCAEGTWSCAGGALSCSDETSSTPETCDGGATDEDCDGAIDEGDAVGAMTWYPDADLDGFGDDAGAVQACARPAEPPRYLDRGGDCDDTDNDVRPGRAERCNGLDDDCDGTIDEGNPCGGCETRVHAGHVYQVCTNARTWPNARSFCMSSGYDLVIVDDAGENAFLASEAAATGVSTGLAGGWWLGISVAADTTRSWVDGSTPTYEAWASGQPNDFPSCGRMWVSSATWADQLCDRSYPFFCELAP